MRKIVLVAAVVMSVLTADQVSKYVAVAELTSLLEGKEGMERLSAFALPGGPVRATGERRVIEDYFHLRYVENPGAVWGILGGLSDTFRRPFFAVVTLLAVVFILWMLRAAERHQRLLHLALALVLGGALGNFVDRLLRGYVVDFLDFHWRNQPGLRWPTFNVADIAISSGVALLLLDAALQSLAARRAARGAQPQGEGPAA